MNSTKLIFGPLWKSEINTIDFSTKMNEALAFWKVLVTLNTPSARELLQDWFNAILIDIDKLELSADKIIETLQNQKKRKLMEAESYKTYCTFLRPEIIVWELVKYIRQFPN
jgi:glycosyltransferase involved in cell wall biosynthesis